jgi:hypothetical protein
MSIDDDPWKPGQRHGSPSNDFGFEETDVEGDESAWDDEFLSDVEEHPFLSSATDLLIAWRPFSEDAGSAIDREAAWDRYFGEPRIARARKQKGARPRKAKTAPLAPTISSDSLPQQALAAAERAVDCLFAFLHALESYDVSAAMKCVSPDYHVVDVSREIDYFSLKLDLEQLTDTWREGTVSISTTEVPSPVTHPAGILIPVTIQVDFTPSFGKPPVSQLMSRICVLRESDPGKWLLSSMARIDRITK